jgi:ABC-type dipeptide/oligopeptide/nickel transport system permease subunit
LFVLGADGGIGRDVLIRVLDGQRTSLEIALGAIVVALAIAVPVGAAAGYFGGAVDAVVSQLTETFMAFPLLLFLLFANRYLVGDFRSLGWSWVVPDGAAAEAVLIGVFTAGWRRLLPRSPDHARDRRPDHADRHHREPRRGRPVRGARSTCRRSAR